MISSLAQSPFLRRLRAVIYRFLNRTTIKRYGLDHTVHYADSLLCRCTFEFQGRNNTLVIGPGCRLWDVKIRLLGENLHCRIGSGCRFMGGQYQLEDRGSRLEIGDNSTIFTPIISVLEGGSVRLGRDCLLAYGSDIRNSDAHSIIDATTRVRLNPAADVEIADHVWIGNQVQILKGVNVGSRCIVAARSVVTGNIPEGSIVAGVPARVVRENVDWGHSRS